MLYLSISNPTHVDLLKSQTIDIETYKQVLELVKKANSQYLHASKKTEHFTKMLRFNEIMLSNYATYKNMLPKEKKEWSTIKNMKTGDRGYVNRYLLSKLERSIPEIYNQVIRPLYSIQVNENSTDTPDLSNDIDALFMLSNIPGYFQFLAELSTYKKGVFNPLRRGYIDFIQLKCLHMVSHFLRAYEQDIGFLEKPLLNRSYLKQWPQMGEILGKICDRADLNHDNPISLFAINSLRSIYISFFNIAMACLVKKGKVPIEMRQILPIIPDRINFNRERLQEENAWKRYQDHHFLFMRLPKSEKEALTASLSKMKPEKRVSWMGCLGMQEIKALVLPMVSQRSRFENLALACQETPEDDVENYPFVARVWKILVEIYHTYFQGKNVLSAQIQGLFETSPPAEEALETERKSDNSGDASDEEKDLTFIRNLTFLVVDDSDKIRQMTIDVLRKEGVNRIFEAADGDQAWGLIQEQPIDVILCDWLMPRLSGIELVQRMMQVESLAKSTTFLMLTTVNDKASIVEALSVGVRGYLIKPFSRKQLLDKVYFATQWLQKEYQTGKIPKATKKDTLANPE